MRSAYICTTRIGAINLFSHINKIYSIPEWHLKLSTLAMKLSWH